MNESMLKLACVVSLIALAACAASPGKPALPDGRERQPVNSAESIEMYMQGSKR